MQLLADGIRIQTCAWLMQRKLIRKLGQPSFTCWAEKKSSSAHPMDGTITGGLLLFLKEQGLPEGPIFPYQHRGTIKLFLTPKQVPTHLQHKLLQSIKLSVSLAMVQQADGTLTPISRKTRLTLTCGREPLH